MSHNVTSEFSFLERRLEGLTPITEEMQSVNSNQESAPKLRPGVLRHVKSFPVRRTGPTIIAWEPDDPENPYNWPTYKKLHVLSVSGAMVVNSAMGSSLPSMAAPDIMEQFSITSREQKVLLVSIYLIGHILGPLLWGPLSEQLGRRNVNLVTFFAFCLFTMACALAPNWSGLVALRLFCGVFGSAPAAIIAGIIRDIYSDPMTRGRVIVVCISLTIVGPILSPIISGFATPALGWRWTFWIGLIVAGITFILGLFIPETFGPILLSRRAKQLRRQSQSINILAPRDLENVDISEFVTVVFTRPLRMIAFEPIVTSTCAYMALVHGIFYLSFQAFPIIFQDMYGLPAGVTGLAFLPIGVGALFSLPIFWAWDAILHKATARNAEWTKREEYRRLPLACIGGPLFVISLFWLGWSARPSTTFVIPMLAGVPFGMGYMMIVMCLLNYMSDTYEAFAVSADVATSLSQSVLAAALPFATSPMFTRLDITGAYSLLGGLSACMCIIPFIFIWKGPNSRARSPFCMILRERREELLQEAEEERQAQMFAELEEKVEIISVK
ncbi:putative MFS-type transporter [Cladobotryum mycophilum]|uniref:MFS-type transporter n=1 Tax=Cladobotryum mycophilum TaxID=491253 RepID=A0ABR0SGX5_9HYPO